MEEFYMFFIKAIATKLVDDSEYPEFVLCEFVDCDEKNMSLLRSGQSFRIRYLKIHFH